MSAIPDNRARDIADLIDAYDQQIVDANDGKRAALQDLRDELAATGMLRAAVSVEVAAFKDAVKVRRLRRQDPEKAEGLEQREVSANAYLQIIEARAQRATRVAETVPTQISPQPAASRSVQNEGERKQGLDQVAQKAEDHKPLSAGAAPAEVHAPDPSNFVTDTGEGEETVTSVDPAPVPDGRNKLQPLDDDAWLRRRFPEKYQGVTP